MQINAYNYVQVDYVLKDNFLKKMKTFINSENKYMLSN